MSLDCGHCGDKVNVTTSDEYLTKNGKLYCDHSCYNQSILSQPRGQNKKQKKKVSFKCPNCSSTFSFMPFHKKCYKCLASEEVSDDINIRLVIVKG